MKKAWVLAFVICLVAFSASTLMADQPGFIQGLRAKIQNFIRSRQSSQKPPAAPSAQPAKKEEPQKTEAPKVEAAKVETPKPEAPKQAENAPQIKVEAPGIKGMSRPELVKEIKDELDSEEEILDYIPQLKKRKDPEGKDYYAYLIGSSEVRLEELDRDLLEKVLARIYNQGTMIRTERITEQLEMIRNTQNLVRQQQTPRVPQAIPRLPQEPPKAPATPPKVPQVPQTPERR